MIFQKLCSIFCKKSFCYPWQPFLHVLFQTEAWPHDERIGTYFCFCVEFWRLIFYWHVIYWDTYQQCTGELQPSSALWLTGGSWVSSSSIMAVLFTRGVALQCHNVLHLRTTQQKKISAQNSPLFFYVFIWGAPTPKKSRRPPHTTGPKPINWKSQPQKPSSRPWPKPQLLNSKTSINEKECTGFNNTRFFLLQFWLFVYSGGMCMSECIMWVMFHFSVLDMCLWWVPCRPWTANLYISYNRSTHQHQYW